ncbi:MAG: DUF1289 domain-containing protein [Solirubrobacteraceae bacterium]
MNDRDAVDSTTAAPILSPCVGVCAISPVTGYCEGCLRTLTEIAQWRSYSPTERRQIMMILSGRAAH